MESRRRKREAELVALSLYDKPALRSEFWRVVCKGGGCRELGTLPSFEMIHAIIKAEFPAEQRMMVPN